MQNREKWRPSKFVVRKGRLTASRDPKQVGVGSRLAADLVASLYEANLEKYCRGRLIDLGCGDVPLYAAYKSLVTDVVCVDWQNTPHKSIYLDHECDLSRSLPFAAGVFDTIILSDVLEHVPEPEQLWREMARILAPGGKLLLNVPFYYCVHEAPHDYYRYTEFALRRFAALAGLEIVLLQPVGGSPEILADFTSKHLQFVPLIGRPLAAAVQGATRVFVRTAIGRKLSERTAGAFPLGYFLVAGKPVQ